SCSDLRDKFQRTDNLRRSAVRCPCSLQKTVVTSTEVVGSRVYGTSQMECVQRLDAQLIQFASSLFDFRGKWHRPACSGQNAERVGLPDWLWISCRFIRERLRGKQLRLARFAKPQDAKYRLRFHEHSELGFVVQRTL